MIMFMLLSEQARGQPTWSLWATWRPRAPCWWSCLKPTLLWHHP